MMQGEDLLRALNEALYTEYLKRVDRLMDRKNLSEQELDELNDMVDWLLAYEEETEKWSKK